MKKAATYDVKIDEFDKRGKGKATVWRENKKGNVGKLSLTIPYTIPGEKVTVTVADSFKKRWETKADEIVKKHEDRIEPACPHFGTCGGCTWQHITYEGQLREKTKLVQQFVGREGFDEAVVAPTIGAETPWHYRNKMEFTFAPDGALGLHEQGNYRKVIPLETCLIAREEMKDVVLKIGSWVKEYGHSGYNKETHEGLLRHVMVRQSFATEEMLVAIFATEGPEDVVGVSELVEELTTTFSNIKGLLWMENRDLADRAQAEKIHLLAGRDYMYDELAGFRYRIWYDTFFQPNPEQAEQLIQLAIEMGKPQAYETMIDLFCGVGTFSLPFAKKVKHVSGVEIVETSIESAKRNARDNDIENTYFLAKDARRGIDDVLAKFGRPDLLLLDPPRSGAGGKVMRRIGRAQPSRIVYVSCNPDTFAQDITHLREFGYTLQKVQPVDQFPQTFHVELVALMSRVDE